MIPLGHYPTPVERLAALCAQSQGYSSELWVKRDDLTHDVYGGNKVRKLEHLLDDARAHGAKRLVTVGAAGSHHVLATTYFGRRAGFEVEAVLVPQPRTEHVMEVLRADLALGLRVFPVRSWCAAAPAVVARIACGARYVPVGGSNVVGAMGYVEAGRELATQVLAGDLPEPDVCVVALGSGGTAGGLAAGFAAAGLRTKVVGVCVSVPPWLLAWKARQLARAALRRLGEGPQPISLGLGSGPRPQPTNVTIDVRFLGDGYGYPTPEGEEAAEAARRCGLTLDPTYTAKTFACALWYVRARRAARVLYWHTLSSAPMAPLLEGAPGESELPASLRALALVNDLPNG